ncbi:hypothetical protein [Niabella aquatica]
MDNFTIITVIIGIILSVIGINYSRKTYRKDHVDKPKEDKLHLLAQFIATKELSVKVYDDLYHYVEKNNAFEQFMWPGISYRTYLTEMKRSQAENLSTELYEELKSSNLPTLTIESMSKSLETQFESLRLIQQEIKMRSLNT